MKRLLCVLLAMILCVSVFSGCQGGTSQDTVATTTEATVPDDGVTRILLIGHSLGNDSSFLLPQIAKNEGIQDLQFGVLYHSGCRLSQHVSFLKSNAREYAYYEFDLAEDLEWRRADCNGSFHRYGPGMANDTAIKDGSIAQTMEFAIMRQDWDIVILQAGAFEATGKPTTDSNLKTENIQTIINYVLEKDIMPDTKPVFGWNMIWALPSDPDLVKESYENRIASDFDGDHFSLYELGAKTVRDVIEPFYPMAYMMPSGTAVENAKSSYLEDKDIYRDYAHATDFTRMMVAYLWLCELTGKSIDEMKLEGAIPAPMLTDDMMRLGKTDLVLTEAQKQILVESVTNAFANPYEMTQSQYTTAP